MGQVIGVLLGAGVGGGLTILAAYLTHRWGERDRVLERRVKALEESYATTFAVHRRAATFADAAFPLPHHGRAPVPKGFWRADPPHARIVFLVNTWSRSTAVLGAASRLFDAVATFENEWMSRGNEPVGTSLEDAGVPQGDAKLIGELCRELRRALIEEARLLARR